MMKYIVKKPIRVVEQKINDNKCVICTLAQILDYTVDDLSALIPNQKVELEYAFRQVENLKAEKLSSSGEIKDYLKQDHLILIGYESYGNLSFASIDGIVHFNPKRISHGVGHTMVCCGYDDEKQAFLCMDNRNLQYTFGMSEIADKGLQWISYDYPVDEAWYISKEV